MTTTRNACATCYRETAAIQGDVSLQQLRAGVLRQRPPVLSLPLAPPFRPLPLWFFSQAMCEIADVRECPLWAAARGRKTYAIDIAKCARSSAGSAEHIPDTPSGEIARSRQRWGVAEVHSCRVTCGLLPRCRTAE